MRNRWVLLGLVLTITGIFVIGCYTILSHPGVKGEEEQTYSGTYYREHCTDCHQDYHQYPYGYYYGYYPDYYWDYPRWGHYYAYPWWWDWYYSGDNGGGGGGGTMPQEKIERQRRNLEPPYVPGTQIISPPVIVQPKSSRGEPSVGTIETGKVKEEQTQQKEEKKENKDEKIPKKKR